MIAAVLLAVPAVTTADVPSTMTVQGRLLDDTGSPPTATYFIHFRIFDQEVGGTELWPLAGPGGEGHSEFVEEGLWTAEIGETHPLTEAVFEAAECWLEVEVGDGGAHPYEVMGRIKLNTSPFSYRVGTVDSASGGTITSDLTVMGGLSLGDPTHTGGLWLYLNGSTKPILTANDNSGEGGEITIFDEDAYTVVDLEADIDGEGGYLQIWGNQAQTHYFRIDGNNAASGAPRMMMLGDQSWAVIDGHVIGDDAVQFGPSSIGSYEIANEPGIANYTRSVGVVDLVTAYQTMGSRTITVPGAGYVLVMAHCSIHFTHTTGTTTSSNVHLSASTPPDIGDPSMSIKVPSTCPSGNYSIPCAPHGIFEVTGPGAYTYYLLGWEQLHSDVSVGPVRLTLIYFETTYGEVGPLTVAAGATGGDEYVHQGGLTAAEIEAEKIEAEAFHRARIETELAQVRAKLEALEMEIQNQSTGDNDVPQE
jgi:hypothetical protein